jgi:hypothetical protein
MTARKPTNPTAAEALAAPIEFAFEGATYGVLPTSEWDLDAIEAYEDGRVLSAIRLILSPGDYQRFRAKRRKAADLDAFVRAMQGALGIAGN